MPFLQIQNVYLNIYILGVDDLDKAILVTLTHRPVNRGAAWYYPQPKPAAKNIKGYLAFWKGVKVESDQEKVRPGLFEWFWK